MTEQNAIQRELAKLDEQWQAFLEEDKAIFHWRVKALDQQLMNTFIKVKEQFDEEDPQFFVQLAVPFGTADAFGWDLAKELNRLMAEAKAEADEDAPVDDWRAPDLSKAASGFHALFASCQAVLKAFADVLENLVLVIAPRQVKDPDAYRQWWGWACKVKQQYAQEWPHNLKLVVFDHADKPFLHQTLQNQPQAKSALAEINLQAAVRDIAEKADDGSDGAKLRLHLLSMNEAIAASDAQKLQQAAELALPIAQHNQWWDLLATLLMTRAAGWLNMQRYKPALLDYQQAQQAATQGLAPPVPGCDKLLLQAMLCEGTTLFLAEEFEHAAKAYERTAEKAEALGDNWLALEAWRMASFSMERLDRRQPAWQFGNRAFALGKTLEEEQRQQSTLPFVGQALLRLSPNTQVKNEVNQAFRTLLGDDWLARVEAASA